LPFLDRKRPAPSTSQPDPVGQLMRKANICQAFKAVVSWYLLK